MNIKLIVASILLVVFNSNLYAAEQTPNSNETNSQVQDMSDPLAVYTQAGFGVSNKGLNLKVGQSYETGSDVTMGMNLIEVKGIAGEQVGWSSSTERDDSIDSVRFRNFTVNTTNGRGKQIDLNYSVEAEQLNASYSFIQALPKLGPVQLYPLAGAGVRIMNGQLQKNIEHNDESYEIDTSVGYTLPGVYGVVGMYSRITVTDNIWINYSPMWLTTIAGSDAFTEQGFAGNNSIFTHEVSISYQFTPRFNARYYSNWTQDQNYFDGDQRIEVNYQF